MVVMAEFDTLIKGGTVVDGLKSGRFVADLGIKDGRIASIAGGIPSGSAAKVLDASGLIVAPGFIDLHTHYDSQVYWDPWCSISGWHGVTSVGIGNCGFGFAPCRPESRDRAMLTMSRNEAVPLETMKAGMPWDWETYPEFLDSLDRTPKGVNLLSYQPLAPLMAYVMGADGAKGRPATDSERAEMCRLLEESMQAGSCGWSAQLFGEQSIQRDYDGTPMITDTMAEADLLAFAGVLRKVGRGFIQAIGASHELFEKLSTVSGRPIIYNVIALTTDQHGVANENFRKTLEWIEDANMLGHRIFAQAVTTEIAFEFTLATWNLFDSSPVWRVVTLGGPDERLRRMKDPDLRQALKDELDNSGENGMLNFSSVIGRGIPALEIHSVKRADLRQQYEGFTVGEIAARDGKHVIDVLLDLAVADNLETTFGTPPLPYDAEQMREMANSSYAIPGISDGGAHTKFMTFGAYPTEYLTKIARDDALVSLEHAHWSLSALPAMASGFRDRGYIREGMAADLVVYDLDRLAMGRQEKAWDYPANEWRQIRKAEGYRWIIVNGAVTFEDGACTGAIPGALLRHGVAAA
jgi:N-acyl-D-aspartate/D-glutamate deacylase